MRHYTSIEQSKKLLELGLSPETADMCYEGSQSIIDPKEREYTKEPFVRGKYTSFDDLRIFYPCWSTGALLEVMPLPSLIKDEFPLSLQKENTEVFGWECICYDEYGNAICEQWSNTKVDACYNMICWLLENKYIKKK